MPLFVLFLFCVWDTCLVFHIQVFDDCCVFCVFVFVCFCVLRFALCHPTSRLEMIRVKTLKCHLVRARDRERKREGVCVWGGITAKTILAGAAPHVDLSRAA
jgi:hypothetical protein